MYFVQLAAEGLRGFQSQASFSFRGKVDVLQVPSEQARADILDVLFHTLFPDAERPDATSDLGEPKAAQRRVILTVAGKDRIPLRLMRSLDSGRCRLYRFNRDTQKHDVLTDSSAEVQQYLRTTLDLPDDVSFERLFMLTTGNRPTELETTAPRSGAARFGFGAIAPSGPGLPTGGLVAASMAQDTSMMFRLPQGMDMGTQTLPPGFQMHSVLTEHELLGELDAETATIDVASEASDSELLALYEELMAAKQQITRVDALRDSLERLELKEEQARNVAKAGQAATTRHEQAKEALRKEATLLELPTDISSHIVRYRARVVSFEPERRKLELALMRAKASMGLSVDGGSSADLIVPSVSGPPDWYREPFFVAAGAATLAFAALAFGFGIEALLVVQVLCGFAAGGLALRAVSTKEEFRNNYIQLRQAKERLSSAEKNFQIETSMVRGLLRRLGLPDVASLEARVERLEALRAHVQRSSAELERQRADYGRSKEALQKIEARKAGLESELRSIGGVQERHEVLERLRQVEARMSERGLLPAKLTPKQDLLLSRALDFDDDDEEEDEGLSPTGTEGGGTAAAPYLCLGVGGLGSGGSYPPSSGGGGGSIDRVQALAETAADLVGRAWEEVLEAASGRTAGFAKLLTGGRCEGARLKQGQFQVREQGHWLGWQDLSGNTLDQVDASLRMSLAEQVLRVRRVPIVFEEPFVSVPPERMDVIRELYRHLSTLTQVLVVTQDSVDEIDVESPG